MKLGILLTAGPMYEEAGTAARIARAALEKGWEVDFFLMEDGIYSVKAGAKAKAVQEMAALLSRGARMTVCAYNAELRGIGAKELLPGVVSGSQYDLAHIVNGCDRFLYFG